MRDGLNEHVPLSRAEGTDYRAQERQQSNTKGKEQGREEGGWGLGTYLNINRKRWITSGSHIRRAGGWRRSTARRVQGPRGSAVWLGGGGSLLHGGGGGSGGRRHSDWPVGSDAPAGRWAAALWLAGGRVRALHVLAVAR